MRHESYDSKTGKVAVTEIPDLRLISVEGFFQRFTLQEVKSIIDSEDVRVVVLRSRLFVRTEMIDLNADDIQQAMLLFQSLEILTAQRAIEITT